MYSSRVSAFVARFSLNFCLPNLRRLPSNFADPGASVKRLLRRNRFRSATMETQSSFSVADYSAKCTAVTHGLDFRFVKAEQLTKDKLIVFA